MGEFKVLHQHLNAPDTPLNYRLTTMLTSTAHIIIIFIYVPLSSILSYYPRVFYLITLT